MSCRSPWMLALWIAAAPVAVHGSMLYTFFFTKAGFVESPTGKDKVTGTLTGTFSGMPDANGLLQTAGVSNTFSTTFDYMLNGAPFQVTQASNLIFFSFDINATGNSLDFSQNTPLGALCVGAVAISGSSLCPGGFPGTFGTFATTSNFPSVTLVKLTNPPPADPPPPPPPPVVAPVAESGTLLLTAAALISVTLWRRRPGNHTRRLRGASI